MTIVRNDEHSTEFGLYLRKLRYPLSSAVCDAQNLDFIWHNYRENWFILIEEKRYGSKSSFAQRDTHGMISQLLEKASGCQVWTAKRTLKKKEYRGYYLIQFQNTSPEDSSWYLINDCVFKDDSGLLHLLTYGSLPEVAEHTA